MQGCAGCAGEGCMCTGEEGVRSVCGEGKECAGVEVCRVGECREGKEYVECEEIVCSRDQLQWR